MLYSKEYYNRMPARKENTTSQRITITKKIASTILNEKLLIKGKRKFISNITPKG